MQNGSPQLYLSSKELLQVACSRCKKSSSIKVVSPAITSTQVKSGASWDSVGSCPNCHHDWSISAFPKMIHESSNLLGWVKPHNCIPVDLLPSHFMVQCVCGSVTSLRGVQIGASCGKGCSRCNKAMALKYSSVAFTPQAQMESKVFTFSACGGYQTTEIVLHGQQHCSLYDPLIQSQSELSI